MDVPLDEVVYVEAIASSSTGAATDADSTPTFAVYEEATDTDVGVGGNMTKRTSLTGDYRASFTASAANGFELGKWYSVIGSATIGGVATKGVLMRFRIIAAESVAGYPPADAAKVGGQTASASGTVTFPNATLASTTNITAGTITTTTNLTNLPAITTGWLTAAGIASGALDAVWSTASRTLTAFAFSVTVGTNNDKTGYSVSGTTTTLDALQTALSSAHGSGSWATATGFSTHSAADVWAVGTRVLTAGTNIQLPSNGLANVTAWTVALTGNITGSLSGSVGSVSGNVGGSVAGSVGSVTSAVTVTGDAATAGTRMLTLLELVSGATYRFTVGALVNAPGGAGSDPLDNELGEYASNTAGGALQRIGNITVTLRSPVAQSGAVSIVPGDDYFAADDRAIEWTDEGGSWPTLTSATVTVELGGTSYAASVVTATGENKKVRWEPTADQTSGMTTGGLKVKATLSNGHVVTLVLAHATVAPST